MALDKITLYNFIFFAYILVYGGGQTKVCM